MFLNHGTYAMDAAKPFIQKTLPIIQKTITVPPFIVDDRVYKALAETPMLKGDMTSPLRELCK